MRNDRSPMLKAQPRCLNRSQAVRAVSRVEHVLSQWSGNEKNRTSTCQNDHHLRLLQLHWLLVRGAHADTRRHVLVLPGLGHAEHVSDQVLAHVVAVTTVCGHMSRARAAFDVLQRRRDAAFLIDSLGVLFGEQNETQVSRLLRGDFELQRGFRDVHVALCRTLRGDFGPDKGVLDFLQQVKVSLGDLDWDAVHAPAALSACIQQVYLQQTSRTRVQLYPEIAGAVSTLFTDTVWHYLCRHMALDNTAGTLYELHKHTPDPRRHVCAHLQDAVECEHYASVQTALRSLNNVGHLRYCLRHVLPLAGTVIDSTDVDTDVLDRCDSDVRWPNMSAIVQRFRSLHEARPADRKCVAPLHVHKVIILTALRVDFAIADAAFLDQIDWLLDACFAVLNGRTGIADLRECCRTKQIEDAVLRFLFS
ncbi:MAG: hypothetical protein MHM6MM_001969 [Cercozoa sp. M6MM]